MKSAVVLLSGGLDSTTTLAIAKERGFSVYALTILYGQRNAVEHAAAVRVAKFFEVTQHKTIALDLRVFGGSSLTDEHAVPHHHEQSPYEIPSTYVPARNTIFLSLALAYAEVIGANDIFFGANIHDYSGYPDCRPEYVAAFTAMANLATKNSTLGQAMTIHAPLVNMSKADIIKRGSSLGVNYAITHSCYDPLNDVACGICSACFYRHKGFVEAGIEDPTRYVHQAGLQEAITTHCAQSSGSQQ